MIVQIGNILTTTDIFTEKFCCDLIVCKGRCCVEGSSGAPVENEEIAALEEAAEAIWQDLSPATRDIISHQGIVYSDNDGDLVTSIVGSRECIFSGFEGSNNCCYCLLERAFCEEKIVFPKPISCALYPLREKHFSNGMIGLNYEKIDACAPARAKGILKNIPLYKFLHAPLVRRYGEKWVEELEELARQMCLV